MRSFLSFAAFAAFVSAYPTAESDSVFPLPDGFPNPSDEQLLSIEKAAFGTLPNGPPPSQISNEGITNLKLIAFNELFEVDFFTQLISNITNKVSGYDLGDGQDYILSSLQAIVAQEELHALSANGPLKAFGFEEIQPCKYTFPVDSFSSAIALAGTFTDVVLGTLQDVDQIFAQNGDIGLVRVIASVIGNEGEQEGFFRLTQGKRPSSQPFLTTSVRDFAFTAIQSFVVPGSCPNIDTIPLKTFKPLNVLTSDISAETKEIQFSINISGIEDWSSLSLVYINQQNVPIVEPLSNTSVEGETLTFTAPFPYEENLLTGLTIAAVTQGSGPFADADAVAQAALFGPGLIEGP
ncbi:late sexual development protein [Aaosphaeria arxii CBS 175.79]|uniref:Late sexual development protein n=1 Tax=Aaosphaeria arxii CBS 175.79 TaxID=1450172 RepID=A0A6A5XDN2_9PLEO|nr:late sexual development protein [Aaosphaeria arxii CBS 175.79]KAF2011128.1 late sexual development protein [Aaosphaeria arxii CBS 175.79]